MSQITTETQGAVRIVRLARPEKKNAFTVAMYEGLNAAFHAAAADDTIRALCLVGSGGSFSAGNDLGDFMQNPPAGEDSPVGRFLRILATFEKPLVAGVDGVAVGLGTTLLLHCDLVVASTRAKFRLPFVNLGLVPEAASSFLLPLVAGRQRAAEWILLGDFFSVEEAHRAGLINRVVDPEKVDETALALATALAARPPEAVRLTKQLMLKGYQEQIASAMTREGTLFFERLRSPEAMQAFMAFMTKK